MPLEQIHPMIVHFPIVLAITALLFDVITMTAPKDGASSRARFQGVGSILMILAGISAIVAFFFGDMAFDIAIGKGVPEAVLEDHEGMGTTTMIAFIVIAAIRAFMLWRGLESSGKARMTAVALSSVAVILVVVTAYFGGQLVYDLGVNIPAS